MADGANNTKKGSRPWLAVEICIQILRLLPISRDLKDDTSIQVLVSCLAANTELREVASLPELWEPHYRARYTQCVAANELARATATNGNMWLMYCERRRLDKQALDLVHLIAKHGRDRGRRAEELVKLSFDVWDVLHAEANLDIPLLALFRKEPDIEERATMLPRRYWAQQATGIITRHAALNCWQRIYDGKYGGSFEEVLNGMSAFYDVSPHQLCSQMDNIADECRSALVAKNVNLNLDSRECNLTTICVHIRAFMRSIGFGLTEEVAFERMDQFPHVFLPPGEMRKTSSISLAYVFVGIVTRLGIKAAPTHDLGIVWIYIFPIRPTEPNMLFDLHSGSDSPPVAISSTNVHLGTAFQGTLTPAHTIYMLERAIKDARLELASQNDDITRNFRYMNSCFFVLERHREYLASCPEYRDVTEDHPLDPAAVLCDGLWPPRPSRLNVTLEPQHETSSNYDSDDPETYYYLDDPDKLRLSRNSASVKYFVGLCVRYRHEDGYIVSWKPLPKPPRYEMRRGRTGGHSDIILYTIILENGHKEHSVFEDSITPINPTVDNIDKFYKNSSAFSRYFVGADIDKGPLGRGRLLMSQETRRKFPEDESAGTSWVNGMAADDSDLM